MLRYRKITIIASSCLAAVLLLAAIISIPNCTGSKSVNTSNVLYISENGKPNYTIVYGDESLKEVAERLELELESYSSVDFEVANDKEELAKKEIRVGITNRSDKGYIDIVNEIGNNGFKINFTSDKNIEIIAFNKESAKNAVSTFIAEYLVKDKNENFIFRTDLGYTSVSEDSTEPDLSLIETKKVLRFNENGDLKILMVSDVHLASDFNTQTLTALDSMIEKEEPALVLILGNTQSNITDKDALRSLLTKLCEPMEKRQIPWAHVFGPMDAESGMSLDLQFEVYSEFEYCLSKKDNASIDGVSNYFLPVLASDSDDIKFGIWGIDSSVISPDKQRGYISPSQVSWFSSSFAALSKHAGTAIPGIMITNNPTYEFSLLDESNASGHFGEDVTYPKINSGLFSAAYATKNILGIYCGYDHINDFSGKYYGIELAYVASIGYDGYGIGGTFETNNELRGARILEIKETDIANYTSKMIYAADYGIPREAK